MEVMAKYSYDATADDELSFRVGDCLKVLQTSGNWYKAELNGVVGFVPKNYINVNFPSWYQEDASRSDAEELLISQPTGTFLIRRSRNEEPGSFSMSVRNETAVQHLKVLRDIRGQYYLWTEKFLSVNQLVEFYKKNSVSKQSVILLQETQLQQQIGRPHHLPSIPPSMYAYPSKDPHQPPPALQLVVALYSFQAEEDDELEFHAGDTIAVVDDSNPAWWTGQLRGQTGLFPSNYTKPMRDQTQVRPNPSETEPPCETEPK